MPKVMARAAICQPTLPNDEAVCPKAALKSSTLDILIAEPVTEPIRYLIIQPTTTEYPIARQRLVITGISEKASPSLLPFPALSVALPKAPIGPAPMARPKVISSTTPVKPMTITHMK